MPPFSIPFTLQTVVLFLVALTFALLCLITQVALPSASQTSHDARAIRSLWSGSLPRPRRSAADPPEASNGSLYDEDAHRHAPKKCHLPEPAPDLCNRSTAPHEEHATGVHVLSLNWEQVELPLVITVFLLLTSLLKIGFHHADFLSTILPESCVLIILGVAAGGLIKLATTYNPCLKADYLAFNTNTFFYYLLPPIMLESAYSLHDREFTNNLGTILTYAVFGTLFNTFAIGPTLWGLLKGGAIALGGGIDITLIECLAFSALLSAVDPVAVLAIFQEVGVNAMLYFLLFGESLLNDAVTVVLYQMMTAFAGQAEVTIKDVGLGVAKFFVVSLGGLVIGAVCGIFTAVITRYTEHVRVVEPLTMFIMAYSSYLICELFHLSGIIAIITCGLLQWQYAVHNVSFKSRTTVKYFSKMLAAICDAIIFLVLGYTIVEPKQHEWNTGFVMWSILFATLYRFMGVFALTWLANRFNRMQKVNFEEQIMMSYGGLRGAIAFALANLLDKENFCRKEIFVTTTVVVILFTVFIQGTTIKPLVKFLRIRKIDTRRPSIFKAINMSLFDHVMSGIEEISGRHGHNYYREILEYYDEKYFKPWLQNTPTARDKSIVDVYAKQALKEHFAQVQGPTGGPAPHQRPMRREGSTVSTASAGGFGFRISDADPYFGRPHPSHTNLAQRGDVQVTVEPPSISVEPPKRGSLRQTDQPRGSPNSCMACLRRMRHCGRRRHTVEEDVLEALDHAAKHGPHVQFRQKYNPNLVDDEQSDIGFQMKQRTIRVSKVAEKQLLNKQRPSQPVVPVTQGGMTSVRSFLTRVGTSMTNLANLGRNRRASAPARPAGMEQVMAVAAAAAAIERNKRKSSGSGGGRDPTQRRASLMHVASLSSMAEEGQDDVAKFNVVADTPQVVAPVNVATSLQKRKEGSDDEDEDGGVLQMRFIAPSATAPLLERIDERSADNSIAFPDLHNPPNAPQPGPEEPLLRTSLAKETDLHDTHPRT